MNAVFLPVRCAAAPGGGGAASLPPATLVGRAAAEFASALAGELSADAVVRASEPLARRTPLRVGGPADVYVEPAQEHDLARVLAFCRTRGLSWFVLGRGSNLLVRDGGYRGVVISLAQPEFGRIARAGDRLRCGAGARLKAVAIEARRIGLAGCEFLEGIPGSVGGALRMNAGAMGAWVFGILESVRFMDPAGQVWERPAADIPVAYRHCPFFAAQIALAAVIRGEPAPAEAIRTRMEAFSQRRWQSQPPQPSAGCMFKNPPTIPAGKLIDELGLKGARVGGAAVSLVHGNFIINEGHATAGDVLALIERIRERARAERGIELETEVEILGDDTPVTR